MKIKKAFAWILAVAMVITLMPSMAFAATINTVPNGSSQTVKSGTTLEAISINLKPTSGTTITSLEGISFKIKLNNAEWVSPNGIKASTTLNAIENANSDGSGRILIGATSGSGIVTLSAISPNALAIASGQTDKEVTITVTGKAIAAVSEDMTNKSIQIEIPAGMIKAGDDEGDITVEIEGGKNGKITSTSPMKIGQVNNSDTKAKIEVTGNVPTLAVHETGETAKIKFTEISAGSMPTGSAVVKMTLSGNATFVDSNGGEKFATKAGLFATISSQTKLRDKEVTINVSVGEDGNIAFPRNSEITPVISIDKDANAGDITVDVTVVNDNGSKTYASVSNLLIAKCNAEAVSVSTAEEVPEIIAGRKKLNDKDQIVQVTLTESMKKSLTGDRYVDFKFPDEIQICGEVKAKLEDKSDFEKLSGDFIDIGKGNGNYKTPYITGTSNEALNLSSFAFKVPSKANDEIGKDKWKTDKANAVTFRIPITVSADYEGDITLDVSGSKAGVNDTSIVVGKAVSPVTIDTKTTEVVIGAQTQTLADVTITEKAPGYFEDERNNDKLVVEIDTLKFVDGMSIQSFDSVDVTAGDVKIGKAKAEKNRLTIPINASSKTASTIEIKGLVVALARTLPEGDYALKVGGNSIIDNEKYNDEEFAEYAATYANYVHIVTPADNTPVDNNPTSADVSSSAKIGEGTYTLNGETVTMVGNPYVDSANRSMFPFRDLAGMCGLDRDKDVSWNNDTRTATITGYGKAVIVSIGNVTMTVIENGVPRYVTMDTEAVIKDNRTYLPARFVAEALGLTVSWDQAAQTVTINS